MINFAGIKEVEFKGYCSGDGESFYWDVDKETYLKIKNMDDVDPYDCVLIEFDDKLNPIMKSDRFRIYPNDIFGYSNNEKERMVYIKWQ